MAKDDHVNLDNIRVFVSLRLRKNQCSGHALWLICVNPRNLCHGYLCPGYPWLKKQSQFRNSQIGVTTFLQIIMGIFQIRRRQKTNPNKASPSIPMCIGRQFYPQGNKANFNKDTEHRRQDTVGRRHGLTELAEI